MMIGEVEILTRMLLAAFLGAVVGFERELANQPAGLRTHIILTVGSSLAMTLSINLVFQFRPEITGGDPSRLAAQVVSGIGFLGAGAILHYGANVRGLTTATSLWTMAIVGLTVGAGETWVAIGTVTFLLFVLSLLNSIEKRFIQSYISRNVTFTAEDQSGMVERFTETLQNQGFSFSDLSISRDLENHRLTLTAIIRTKETPNLSPLIDSLASLEGVKTISIH